MSSKIKFLVLILVLGLLAFLAYYYRAALSENLGMFTIGVQQEPEEVIAGGALLLTLAPKSGTGIYNYPMILPIDTKEIRYSYLEQLKNGYAQFAINHNFSPNKRWITFIGIDKASTTQVFLSSTDGLTNVVDVFEKIKDTQMITTSLSDKISTSINNAGNIIYSSVALGQRGTLTPLSKYEIHYIDKTSGQTVERKLGIGGKAKWVDNENYIFLRSRGLYFNNITKPESEAVQLTLSTVDGKERLLADNVMFDISKDGKMIVLTDPSVPEIILYSLNLENISLTEIASISEEAFWPTFSPEGRYIAVQTADFRNIKINPKPTIKFFKISSTNNNHELASHGNSIDLDAYHQDYMFIDTWIK